MVNNEAMEAVIHDLKSQDHPNYAVIARKFNISAITLAWCFKSESISLAEDYSRNQKLFTNAQESIFIEHIKKFADLSIPPSLQIIRNLVVEVVKHLVGEHWVKCFRKCYSNEFISFYMCCINQSKHVADNVKHFEHYFQQMCLTLLLI